jgi:hypothetical protein
MNTKNLFSTVVRKPPRHGVYVELSYDDVIRVVVPSSESATATAPATALTTAPATAPGYLLQGQSAIGLSCTNPNCTSGTPPLRASDPISIEIQTTATVEALASGGQRLLVETAGSQISIPILDAPMEAGQAQSTALCTALAAYRRVAALNEHTDFHVYRITDTPSALSQLQCKWIALPVPCRDCPVGAGEARP